MSGPFALAIGSSAIFDMKLIQVCTFAAFFCLTNPVAGPLLAQDPLPGGKNATARQLQREYRAMMLRGVQLFSRDWDKACGSHNVREMSELYLKTANVLTAAGPEILGRDSISALYKAGFSLIRGCRMTYGDVVASGDLASINGRIQYDLALPTGGSISHSVPFQMSLRLQYKDEWRIESQTGGDLPPVISVIAGAKNSMQPGTSDSIQVRVTDALGHPITNTMVVFSMEAGDGIIAPVSATTDYRGLAAALLKAGAKVGDVKVRVSTSLNNVATFHTIKIGPLQAAPSTPATVSKASR